MRDPTSADRIAYLDSSALVKLVVRESGSAALRRFLRGHRRRASCALARVEVVRAVRPQGTAAVTRARRILQRLDLLRLDDALLESAAMLEPSPLRSLDAIHLAAARTLGEGTAIVVTYDDRMRSAAEAVGLEVVSPRDPLLPTAAS